jgi:hypothetical protein
MLRWQFCSILRGEWSWEVSSQRGPIARSSSFTSLEAAQAEALRLGYKPASGESSDDKSVDGIPLKPGGHPHGHR